METWSQNLFLEGSGQILAVAGGLLIVATGFASAIGAASLLHDRPSWVQIVAALACLLGVPAVGFWSMPTRLGTVSGLSEVHVDGVPHLRGRFSWSTKSGSRSATRMFEVESGRLVGSRRHGGLFSATCSRAPHQGWEVCLDPPYAVHDLLDFSQVATLQAPLDERFGRGQYRVQRFGEGVLQVERLNGDVQAVPLDTLVELPSRTWQPMDWSCSVQAPLESTRVQGVLRGIACPVGDGRIVLHRSTAFGPAGHLLSFSPDTTGHFAWTVVLRPWIADDSRVVRIAGPRIEHDRIVLWTTREDLSVVRLQLDRATGTVVDADVVF